MTKEERMEERKEEQRVWQAMEDIKEHIFRNWEELGDRVKLIESWLRKIIDTNDRLYKEEKERIKRYLDKWNFIAKDRIGVY